MRRLLNRRLFLIAVSILLTYILVALMPPWMYQGGILSRRQRPFGEMNLEGITAQDLGLIQLPNVDDIKIFYNRIPKCGSRAVLSVFQTLGNQRHYNVVSAPRGMGRNWFRVFQDEENFVKIFQKYHTPLVYSRHIHFVNFTQHGQRSPLYINVMRDPIERLVSHYYFDTFGSKNSPKSLSTTLLNASLDSCIKEERPFCVAETGLMNTVIPFFCGHGRQYFERSVSMLQRAKDVIRRHYIVVGLTEDIPGFFEVLETVLPKLFYNASTVYKSYESMLKRKYKTALKFKPKKYTLRRLRVELAYEYNLYNFVKQRFYNLRNKIRVAKAKQFACRHNLFCSWRS